MKTSTYKFTISALALMASAAPAALADGDPQEGAVIGYSCLGCHGIEGYRNAYPGYRVPKLGGQNSAYVGSSLRAYRDGQRDHPTMNAQGGSLSDEDINDVVAWLATYGASEDAATTESVSGVAAAEACVACHGETGSAVEPTPPTLSGQHQDYLVHALQNYRDGKRAGTVMSAFVATLSEADIEAVAHYYATQEGLFTPNPDE